jgi:hypothetical protein
LYRQVDKFLRQKIIQQKIQIQVHFAEAAENQRQKDNFINDEA